MLFKYLYIKTKIIFNKNNDMIISFFPQTSRDHNNIQTLQEFENEFNLSNSVFRTTVTKNYTINENYSNLTYKHRYKTPK